MADRSTYRALRRAQRWRTAIPLLTAAVIGVLLRAGFDFDPANSIWLLVEPLAVAAPLIEEWLRSNLMGDGWASWVSSPLLLMLLFAALAKSTAGKRVLHSIVRDPPWFACSDLEAERRRTMLNLEREPVPLIGRDEDLSELAELTRGHHPFSWRALVGPTGIGKSRLGIEWLDMLRKEGWDVGVVRSADLHALGGWQPRRRTALLIDDARRWWDKDLGALLVHLAEASSVGRKVRLLVADQSQLAIDLGLGEHRERLMDLKVAGPLRLGGLSNDEISALQVSSGFVASQRIADAAAGRPRAALLMLRGAADTYSAALREWVRQMIPALADDLAPFPIRLGGPLFLSSLAGPIPLAQVRIECGDVDIVPLSKFYDKSDVGRLHEFLPLLEPDDLAVALTVALLPRIDAERRQALMHRALAWNISAVEDRLGTLSEWLGESWRAGCGETVEITWLRWMQEQFDKAAPERVEAIRVHAQQLLDDARGASTAQEQTIHSEDACYLARRRPFDPELATIECAARAVGVRLCASQKDFAALETWAEGLLRLLALRAEFRSAKLDRGILEGMLAAADSYAAAARPDGLIRWVIYLAEFVDSLTDDERIYLRSHLVSGYANILHGLGLNRRVEEMEAVGQRILVLAGEAPAELGTASAAALASVRAVCIYGQLRRPIDMTRWFARLFALCADPSFEGEAEIRALEAEARADAVGHLCEMRRFSEAENHWLELTALAGDERFSSDVRFSLRQCEAASIAMKYHGEAGDYAGIELWGLRLNRLAEEANSQADEETRRRQLHGTCSAVTSYGYAGRHEDMLRWAGIGLSVAREPRLAGSIQVQEMASSLFVNVTNVTGRAGMYDEMISWGDEVIRLSEDPRFFDNPGIQESIAQAAGNIAVAWSQSGGSPSVFMNWMRFIARHAQHYDMQAGVQAVAAVFRLSATEQLLDYFPHGKFERRSAVVAEASKKAWIRTETRLSASRTAISKTTPIARQ